MEIINHHLIADEEWSELQLAIVWLEYEEALMILKPFLRTAVVFDNNGRLPKALVLKVNLAIQRTNFFIDEDSYFDGILSLKRFF